MQSIKKFPFDFQNTDILPSNETDYLISGTWLTDPTFINGYTNVRKKNCEYSFQQQLTKAALIQRSVFFFIAKPCLQLKILQSKLTPQLAIAYLQGAYQDFFYKISGDILNVQDRNHLRHLYGII